MKKRTYTVTDAPCRPRNTPMFKVSGDWLKDAGINVGDRLELIDSKNMLIFLKIPMYIVRKEKLEYTLKDLQKELDKINKQAKEQFN